MCCSGADSSNEVPRFVRIRQFVRTDLYPTPDPGCFRNPAHRPTMLGAQSNVIITRLPSLSFTPNAWYLRHAILRKKFSSKYTAESGTRTSTMTLVNQT